MRNVSNTFYINCFDGAVCPVSTSSVTWEVEPANQDNEMIMNDVIMFTSLTPENNGTTIQCSLFCLNCSDLRRSNTVTLVVNGKSINYRVISYEVNSDHTIKLLVPDSTVL